MNPKKALHKVRSTPMEKLCFRDFAALKVPGRRDRFSSMRHAKLRAMLDATAAAAIDARLDEPRHQATAYRWHLRGLDAEKAIRKIKTDLEVSRNAAGPSLDQQIASDPSLSESEKDKLRRRATR